MRVILLAISIAFSVLSTTAVADSTKVELHERFLLAIGIYEQIEQQTLAIEKMGIDTAQRYSDQISESFPDGVPEKYAQDAELIFAAYMTKVSEIMDADAMAKTYMELISERLTDTEIAKITDFYETELGKKFTESNAAVMGEWSTITQGDIQSKLGAYTQEFVESLVEKASSY